MAKRPIMPHEAVTALVLVERRTGAEPRNRVNEIVDAVEERPGMAGVNCCTCEMMRPPKLPREPPANGRCEDRGVLSLL